MQTMSFFLGVLLGILGIALFWMPHRLHSNSHIWKFCFHGNISHVPTWQKHTAMKATGVILFCFSLLAFYTTTLF